ncbi:site-specific DNA-methyltransferase [Candidatus Saganbacteria bacterium CG08_land_8_20_14_0_20_45_16]|uniref:Methyltransferase n=1 Tax=Candidatus Saganbacteria bacterium CG08_land_8_20_14_0_20_45_16 TaxID=2014293 RepID=A0A2H0XUG1_UNCSA|nr:MAG: site-specific DNA-methyltransferase [Candidatus Saganbacteria bacterium CG08_land_8_20_14_0_20_45_16]
MSCEKEKAPRNQTIVLDKSETNKYSKRLIHLHSSTSFQNIINTTINQDVFEAFDYLPDKFIDLLFIDPPYNLNKKFNTHDFKAMGSAEYEEYIDSWLSVMLRMLKPTASIYICGDWRSSSAIYNVMLKYFIVRNRITWEREKGRGALSNWKNCIEDIWFGTVSNEYRFDVDAVKLKRKVVAPYKDKNGNPKDWVDGENGAFRITHPSNIWTDITIPYWSMAENTDHPTQKPEKLLAKIILASSKPGDLVFDPFLGSGTTSVVAKKLGRNYCGIEIDDYYACLAEKRLDIADHDRTIQGYHDGIFWERNSLGAQKRAKTNKPLSNYKNITLFEQFAGAIR